MPKYCESDVNIVGMPTGIGLHSSDSACYDEVDQARRDRPNSIHSIHMQQDDDRYLKKLGFGHMDFFDSSNDPEHQKQSTATADASVDRPGIKSGFEKSAEKRRDRDISDSTQTPVIRELLITGSKSGVQD